MMDSKKQDLEVDNSRLDELIKSGIIPQIQRDFFEILKESRLYMSVDFGDAFHGIENKKPRDVIEGPEGFSIQFLTDSGG